MKYILHPSVLLLVISLILNSCHSREKLDFSPFISGYTGGVIKSNSTLQIYLSQAINQGYQIGSELPADLFKISPEIKGKTVLKDDNSIEFIPDERFKNGTTYQVKFKLGALCEVPSSYQTFEFTFDIIPLVTVFENGCLLSETGNENALQYQGILHSSDEIDPSEIEKSLTATYDGRSWTPEWNHQGNRHYFSLRQLTKGAQSKSLSLKFSKEIQATKETLDIPIPGLNDFTVLNIKASESEPPVISIYMSENVDPNQDLKGLFRLAGNTALNYKITDNVIYLYPSNHLENDQPELTISAGIRSTNGHILQDEYTRTVPLSTTKPQVQLIGKGVIVPDDNRVVIPFSAIALKAVDLEIIQVLNENMNFFLQKNAYDEYWELNRSARPVFMQKIDLQEEHPHIDLNKWNDFTIDLSKLVKLEKGNIYRFRLKFKKSYTTLPCASEEPDSDYGSSNWDNSDYYYSEYYYPNEYEWEQRDNPSHLSYYTGKRFASRNLINTSLGIMAKGGADNQYIVCISDLNSAEAVSNCKITLFNYQNQKIDSAVTDQEGFAYLKPASAAFIVLAQKGRDKAWLRLPENSSLSLSNFDVSGQHVQMGVKGFIYGERGVWRPGDEIHLSLILEDKMQVLPQGHPIIAQLIDPNGHIVQSQKGTIGDNNIHCFTFKTVPEAQTGYWHALFRIGGLTFKQSLRIETVKPNRLAIQMQFAEKDIIGKGINAQTVQVKTNWLNGAPTSKQKAHTEVRLYPANSVFPAFPNYSFSDKSRYFETATVVLYDGQTDEKGNFSFSLEPIKTENAPGLLNAVFTTRVFENAGDFSISSQNMLYSPYQEYVGIRLPESEDQWYSTQKPVRLDGVTLSPNGQQGGNASIRIEIYKLDWRWWWDAEDEHRSAYVNREYSHCICRQEVQAQQGKFQQELNISEPGRYLIRAIDPSGHTASQIAYFGSWSDNQLPEAATMLHLSTDKQSYQVGEKIQLRIPSSTASVAIISLENGKRVEEIKRIPTTAGTTTFELEATSQMCPNTYIAVTLLQPHSQRDNDRPIRMYGVTNVNIEDPGLQLHPVIRTAAELHPGKEFEVTISEKEGKAMNYTIAIVDEGLLSLTAFRTPDPFAAFYAREALGVKTWDFYDYIYGAYGARLDQAFAVGGDEALKNLQNEQTNRFQSVVLFEGPFTLKAGSSQKHRFKMPEYIGEVRTMVIAAQNGRYGSSSLNSKVSNPLMVSLALPRLFSPGDIINLPVTVFAMKKNIQDVTVQIQTDDKITLLESSSKQLHFDQEGEKTVCFKARINQTTGLTALQAIATAQGETARTSQETQIRIPNPKITTVEEQTVASGESVSFDSRLNGAEPTSVLEISSIPPLNLEQRLNELLEYPHGCVEQITSQAFPLLSLNRLLTLTPEQQIIAENHIREVIQRLSSYQTTAGCFAYWPGNAFISEWATTYVVDFLATAQQQGYSVPSSLLRGAIRYLKQNANSWNHKGYHHQQEQAYRLYVLAAAGEPDLAAMNRLKEIPLERPVSQWLLAAAYALSHQPEIAQKMIRNLSAEVSPYRETGGCFGSTTRDQALILRSMILLNMRQEAYRMLEKISRTLGSQGWCSTQESSFALLAAAQFVQKYLGNQSGIHVTLNTPQGTEQIQIDKTIWQKPLILHDHRATATVKNNGQGKLFVRQINREIPLESIQKKSMSGLLMSVQYYDNQGRPISIDRVKQGEDILTEITVRNTGLTGSYQELALTYLVPSGFEIINDRLTGNISAWKESNYTDIRDDRFYVYFNLEQHQTKTFRFRCNAAFKGEYQLPAIQCSAMYDNDIQAILPGGKITIE